MYDHPFHGLLKGFKRMQDSITAKTDTRKNHRIAKISAKSLMVRADGDWHKDFLTLQRAPQSLLTHGITTQIRGSFIMASQMNL